MLNSLLYSTQNTMNGGIILLCTICSIVFGLVLGFTHKWTSRTNKNFLMTLTLLPLITQYVILLINNNIGLSIAIAGTFGLVRFRSALGTSREILMIFFAMVIGLATGLGYVLLGGIITILGCFLLTILSKMTFYDNNRYERTLKIVVPEDLDYTEIFDDLLKKYTKSSELLQVKTINLGSMFELEYAVVLKKETNEKEFIDALRIRNGNLKVMLSHIMSEREF